MGWDNAGGYNRQHNFSADASSGIKILALRMDQELDDFASAMTIAWARNGQNVPTTNIPMGGRTFINVGAATSVNNFMRVREFIENIPVFMQDAESSADRISVSAQYFTSVSANQAPGEGTRIFVRANSDKSSAVLYLNGHSANVEYQDGNRIGPALVSGGLYEFLFSSVDVAWKIQNPDDGRTAAEIAAGVTPTNYQYRELDINRYGPDGTVAGDTLAFQNAVAVAGQYAYGGTVELGEDVYYLGAVGELPTGIHFRGVGDGTVLMKSTASAVFTVKTFDVRFSDLRFNADVGTSTTYGTSGTMIDYVTGFASAYGKLTNVDSANIDTVIRFAGDAGEHHQVIGGYWIAYTLTAGSEGLVYQTGNGSDDTGALFRKIVGLTTDGEIDQRGAIDSILQAVDCRRVRMDSDTAQLNVIGGRWGSLDIAVTIDGQNTRIIGVSVSGSITLAATLSGACVFKGNIQTSGTFTNNAPAQVCEVEHHPLSTGYTHINKHTISHSNNAEEVQTRRIGANSGDADTTLTLDQSQTVVMYGSAITADRAVNLPATGRNGFTFRVVRQAGATGAFNINVGSGPLKALAAAGEWCEVQWSAAAAAWVLTAAGSL